MRILVPISAALMLCACASTQIKTDHDPTADFSRYRTYTLERGKVVSDEQPAIPPNPLVEDRISRAIGLELAKRGLHPASPGQADLIATYTAGAREKQDLVTAVSPAVGPYDQWYWGPGFEDVWVDQYREGTLVIDLLDARTRKLVWRAIARAEDKDFNNADFIRATVDKALDKYPPQQSAKQ
jgi:hypothetical protein